MSQHIDMPVHQWRLPGDFLTPGFFSMTAHPAQCFLHIKRVPQYRCVSDQAQYTQLIFLPFTIAFSDLTALAITNCTRHCMAAFSPIEFQFKQ